MAAYDPKTYDLRNAVPYLMARTRAALFDAVDAELQRYEVEAVTGGTDALGEVSVSVRANGRLASGQGVATDILEASARAFVRAISNALEGVAIREAEEATADAAVERTPGP